VFVHAAGWGNAMVQSSRASAYRVHRNGLAGIGHGEPGCCNATGSNSVFH